MIPAAFDYVRAESVAHAVEQLGRLGEDAKVLAGGHSLIPLMRLRLAQPAFLVDIRGVAGLDGITLEGDRLVTGALVTHARLASDPIVLAQLPILAAAAREVGDNQVRNRGTVGGVMAHADAAGDYPTLALMLDAEIITDRRRHAARDFFTDVFTTALEPDEIVTGVSWPLAPGRHRYLKFRRRLFDWAIVGVGVQELADGWRIGLTNAGPTPVRAADVEAALRSGEDFATAAMHAADGLNPSADLRASADYKRHLARVLTRRALEEATAPQPA